MPNTQWSEPVEIEFVNAGSRTVRGPFDALIYLHDMQACDKLNGIGGAPCLPHRHIRQQGRQRNTRTFRKLSRLAGSRMEREQLIDGRACRTLATFVQPHARHHGRKIGTPNARNEGRLRC